MNRTQPSGIVRLGEWTQRSATEAETDGIAQSVTSSLTGVVGVLVANAAVVWMSFLGMSIVAKSLTVVVLTALAMIIVDLRQGTFLRPRTGWRLQAEAFALGSVNRLLRKVLALVSIAGTIACFYAIFPEYEAPFFAPFWEMLELVLPVVALCSPFYLIYVDFYQSDREDAYAQLGGFLSAQSVPQDWGPVRNLLLGWVVKAFFLPLMVSYLCGNLQTLWNTSWLDLNTMKGLWDVSYNYLFVFDLLFAVVGYSCTLKLLGTEIRTVEPTAAGWVACLICYEPFSNLLGSHYLASETDKFYWGDLTENLPVLYAIWGGSIIILTAIYVWATISFGLRFSNLTNRGIITSGPYRWTKHPAYISKCIAFWLISVPFLSTQGWAAALSQSLLLAMGNVLYVIRARTEERHLSSEPAYREYAAYIARHGLVARATSLLERAPAPGTRSQS